MAVNRNREGYDAAMNAGHNAAWDQDWNAAIQSYGKAVQAIPDDPDAHIHLGLALLEAGRLDDALKVYSRAHQLSPQDPIPLEKSADVLERMGRLREAAQQYVNVAEIYFSERDLAKALANWERATKLTPGLVAIHAKLAQVRERIGDNRGAVSEYLTLAYNFQRLGDVDKALKSAQRALRLDRNNALVLNTIRALESGQDVQPPADNSVGPDIKGRATGFDGGRGPGTSFVGEADPLGPMGEAMTEALSLLASYVIEEHGLDAAGGDALQAMEWQRQGLHDEAIGAYQRAEAHLRHPALELNLGVLLVLANRQDEAIRHLTDASSVAALAAGAYHALGQAYFRMGEYKKATRSLIQSLEAVDTQLTTNPVEAQELNSIYERLHVMLNGRNDEQLEAVDRRFVKMLEGKDWKQRIAETRRQMDETMRDQGDQSAVDILADSRGDKLTESVALIDRYFRSGLLTLAMDEAHRAVEFSPHYLPIHIRMAEIMMRENRVRSAITKYNTVARTYLVRGENDRAAAILSEVLEMAPLDISVRENLIELLEAEERWDEAIDQYIDLADTYHQLGNFDLSRDTFSLAERTANRVQAAPEKIVRIKHRIADIDQMRLDSRRAQKLYEEIVQLAPDDERAHKMLVELNYRQNNTLEGIRRLDQLLSVYAGKRQINKITGILEEMVTLYPNDTGLRSRLGAIYRQLGRTPDAIVQLDALGELQLEAGLHKDAANTIRQIIALNPPGVEDYKRLLSQLGG